MSLSRKKDGELALLSHNSLRPSRGDRACVCGVAQRDRMTSVKGPGAHGIDRGEVGKEGGSKGGGVGTPLVSGYGVVHGAVDSGVALPCGEGTRRTTWRVGTTGGGQGRCAALHDVRCGESTRGENRGDVRICVTSSGDGHRRTRGPRAHWFILVTSVLEGVHARYAVDVDPRTGLECPTLIGDTDLVSSRRGDNEGARTPTLARMLRSGMPIFCGIVVQNACSWEEAGTCCCVRGAGKIGAGTV